MADVLPQFRYHSDPVATGSIVASDDRCVACERARGFVYTGPTYAVEDLTDSLCPWCIADGSAASRFDASFTDIGHDVPDDVPDAVVTEVAERTPGYTAWQQEEWLYHCADACDYLGAADEPGATTYRFRCLHCGMELVRSDQP